MAYVWQQSISVHRVMVFFFFSFNDVCNKEGRIDLFAPNLEDDLDGSLHQQHE